MTTRNVNVRVLRTEKKFVEKMVVSTLGMNIILPLVSTNGNCDKNIWVNFFVGSSVFKSADSWAVQWLKHLPALLKVPGTIN